jgi:hypothetical protein
MKVITLPVKVGNWFMWHWFLLFLTVYKFFCKGLWSAVRLLLLASHAALICHLPKVSFSPLHSSLLHLRSGRSRSGLEPEQCLIWHPSLYKLLVDHLGRAVLSGTSTVVHVYSYLGFRLLLPGKWVSAVFLWYHILKFMDFQHAITVWCSSITEVLNSVEHIVLLLSAVQVLRCEPVWRLAVQPLAERKPVRGTEGSKLLLQDHHSTMW